MNVEFIRKPTIIKTTLFGPAYVASHVEVHVNNIAYFIFKHLVTYGWSKWRYPGLEKREASEKSVGL